MVSECPQAFGAKIIKLMSGDPTQPILVVKILDFSKITSFYNNLLKVDSGLFFGQINNFLILLGVLGPFSYYLRLMNVPRASGQKF